MHKRQSIQDIYFDVKRKQRLAQWLFNARFSQNHADDSYNLHFASSSHHPNIRRIIAVFSRKTLFLFTSFTLHFLMISLLSFDHSSQDLLFSNGVHLQGQSFKSTFGAMQSEHIPQKTAQNFSSELNQTQSASRLSNASSVQNIQVQPQENVIQQYDIASLNSFDVDNKQTIYDDQKFLKRSEVETAYVNTNIEDGLTQQPPEKLQLSLPSLNPITLTQQRQNELTTKEKLDDFAPNSILSLISHKTIENQESAKMSTLERPIASLQNLDTDVLAQNPKQQVLIDHGSEPIRKSQTLKSTMFQRQEIKRRETLTQANNIKKQASALLLIEDEQKENLKQLEGKKTISENTQLVLVNFKDYTRGEDGVYDIIALNTQNDGRSLSVNSQPMQKLTNVNDAALVLSTRAQEGISERVSAQKTELENIISLISSHQNNTKLLSQNSDQILRIDQNIAPISPESRDMDQQLLSANRPNETLQGQNIDPFQFAVSNYIGNLFTKISENHTYPEEAKSDLLRGEVIIRFSVTPDGQVVYIEIARSSGHEILDQAALESIKKSTPFEVFSTEIGQKQLDFRIPIRFGWSEG